MTINMIIKVCDFVIVDIQIVLSTVIDILVILAVVVEVRMIIKEDKSWSKILSLKLTPLKNINTITTTNTIKTRDLRSRIFSKIGYSRTNVKQ